MRTNRLKRLAALVTLLLPAAGCAAEPGIAAVYERVSESVVTIVTEEWQVVLDEQHNRIGERPLPAIGAGVVINDDGYVMTAAHLVQTADHIGVRFRGGHQSYATVLASDPFQDLALLALDNLPRRLQPAVLGDSDRVRVGDPIFVIGAPYGIEHALSVGYISARHRPESAGLGLIDLEMFQTDAAINEGNSGSPVFSLDGKVVGIANGILTQGGGSEGLGFAVTSNAAVDVLLRHRPFWTGMTGLMLAGEVAALFNVPQKSGYLVQRVAAGSPAERIRLLGSDQPVTLGDIEFLAGGDILLDIDGIEFSENSMRQIQEHTAALEPGQVVALKVLRRGQVITLEAAL